MIVMDAVQNPEAAQNASYGVEGLRQLAEAGDEYVAKRAERRQ